jgi:hypothetical protein
MERTVAGNKRAGRHTGQPASHPTRAVQAAHGRDGGVAAGMPLFLQRQSIPPIGHEMGQWESDTAEEAGSPGLLADAEPLQTKLTVGQPGDMYEQEAERMAEQVMRMPEPQAPAASPTVPPDQPATIQWLCTEGEEELQPQPIEEGEEEKILQAKPLADQITPFVQRQAEPTEHTKSLGSQSTVSSNLEHRITALQGNGQPLSQPERAFFEPRFGVDFSQVRIHTNQSGSETARAVSARAFTVGKNVVFGEGQYQPGTSEGHRLLGHELMHVVQQNSGQLQRETTTRGRIANQGGAPSERTLEGMGPPEGHSQGMDAAAVPLEGAVRHDIDPAAVAPQGTDVHGNLEKGRLNFPYFLAQTVYPMGDYAARLAAGINTRAYTPGGDMVFGAGQYDPGTRGGAPLLAHEVFHAAQQTTRAVPVIQRDIIPVDLVSIAARYRAPNGQEYQAGDAAGPCILMRFITEADGSTTFQWYNFLTGRARSGTPSEWSLISAAANVFGTIRGFAELGRQLTPQQWVDLWPNPVPRLLELYEQRQLTMPQSAVLTTYQGMIASEAARRLDENEASIDELLNAPDRVQTIQDYATGLREASQIRDALEQRRVELNRRLVQSQAFSFGFAGRFVNMDPFQRLQTQRELAPVEQALTFWRQAFPLLTRLRTSEMRAERVEDTLRTIKGNIISTRAELIRAERGQGSFEMMDLQGVRAQLSGRLGPRVTAVIEEEDASRRRWAWIRGGAILAGGIALMFLPGGQFVLAAVGLAIAAHSIADAIEIGRAANTGLSVDEGLMTQAQAAGAVFQAVLSTVLALAGTIAPAFRIIRVGRAFVQVRAGAAELELTAQMRLARLIASRPELLTTLRSSQELQALLEGVGVQLSLQELQALRAVIYTAQGAQAGTSRASLMTLLRRVWQNRQTAARSNQAVYRMYSGLDEGVSPFASQAERAAYNRLVATIEQNRPPGAYSSLQGAPHDPSFLQFFRSGIRPERISFLARERVYLNVTPEGAPGAMEEVVRQVVDNAGRFPGVLEAKIAMASQIGRRSEAIVIYCENTESASRVLTYVRGMQQEPNLFVPRTPAMTEPVAPGISVGQEPVTRSLGSSFGDVRSNLITRALRNSLAQGDDEAAFIGRVLDTFRRNGIDPDQPHLNLPAVAP